jgi:hypothetical protein
MNDIACSLTKKYPSQGTALSVIQLTGKAISTLRCIAASVLQQEISVVIGGLSDSAGGVR